jgi:murein DD-endopeptidase MepM/ murein hydrolase activator NlpD
MTLTRSTHLALSMMAALVAFTMTGSGAAGPAARQASPIPPPLLAVSHQARAVAPGEAVLLTFNTPGALAAVRGTAFGAPFVGFAGDSPRTWHALVGVDLDTKPGPSLVEIEARTADGSLLRAGYPLAVVPKTFSTRRLFVAPEFVTPPASEQARIEGERVMLTRVLAGVSPRRLWGDGFARPTDGELISLYGVRSVFNGQPRAPHRGVDFRGATGTPVSAPAGGLVVLAEGLYFAGTTVILDHGLGVFSMLCHLSRVDARKGAVAARGDIIGAVGATGRVTGPHLHWTLRVGPASVDPLSVLSVVGLPR